MPPGWYLPPPAKAQSQDTERLVSIWGDPFAHYLTGLAFIANQLRQGVAHPQSI
jgi:hypothetical protein